MLPDGLSPYLGSFEQSPVAGAKLCCGLTFGVAQSLWTLAPCLGLVMIMLDFFHGWMDGDEILETWNSVYFHPNKSHHITASQVCSLRMLSPRSSDRTVSTGKEVIRWTHVEVLEEKFSAVITIQTRKNTGIQEKKMSQLGFLRFIHFKVLKLASVILILYQMPK